MSAWADSLLLNSIQGGLAALVVFTLFRALPRIPGTIQAWMWRAVAINFLVGMIGLPSSGGWLLVDAVQPSSANCSLQVSDSNAF